MKYFFWVISALISLSAQADVNSLKALLHAAEDRGLPISLYLKDSQVLNTLDLNGITKLAEKLAQDLAVGRVLSTNLGEQVHIASKPFLNKNDVSRFLKNEISLTDLLALLEPKNEIYKHQLEIFRHLRQIKNSGPNNVLKFPTTLKMGTTTEQEILFLRQRLNIFGYKNTVELSVFDEELDLQVKNFQSDHKLLPDGVVGGQTWQYLNQDIDSLLSLAMLNLDRTRWLPDQLPSERVFVNLAEQRFRYYQDNELVLDFKAINGRVDRQTPLMIDSIRNVVLNPTWTVPFSIFVKDKLRLIKADPRLIKKMHMKLINDLTGKEVDALQVNWSQVNATNLHYTLVQLPGPWNALGFIKFPLQNPHAIYLHDTDGRHLFINSNRQLSSGCVRIEKPFDFAEKILGTPKWTIDTLMAATKNSARQVTEQSWLKTKNAVPVYLFYQTIYVNTENRIVVMPDHYKLDKVMYLKFISGS